LDSKPLPTLSKATTEALFVGVAKNLENLEKETIEELKKRYLSLRENELFSVNSLKEGLAQKDKVVTRLNKSIEIFG
jgi:hypothetical protein